MIGDQRVGLMLFPIQEDSIITFKYAPKKVSQVQGPWAVCGPWKHYLRPRRIKPTNWQRSKPAKARGDRFIHAIL